MHQAGPFNPAFDAERFGLKNLKSISYNFEAPRLVEDAIRLGEALVAKGGALSAGTGIHTGRSQNDKFTVPDGVTDKAIWWEKATTPQAFDTLYADMLAHAKGMQLYSPLRRLVGSYLVH
jgi:phosphoenolpyruvate carboxykinase (ATP)